jgi:hypothetical protein
MNTLKLHTFLMCLFLMISSISFGQENRYNGVLFPIFPDCEKLTSKERESCFYDKVNAIIYESFVVPDDLKNKDYKGTITVLFEVDEKGAFYVQFIDTNESILADEVRRVFKKMPIIKPATYNGVATYQKIIIKIDVPLKTAAEITAEKVAIKNSELINFSKKNNQELTELEAIVLKKFKNPQFESHLDIPYSHSYYAHFDQAMNQVGSNNHTTSKPISYVEVNKYYNLKSENEALKKANADGWWSKKFFNENMVEIQGDEYWFTLNPLFDLQAGKDNSRNTYLNTRGIQFRGELGKIVSFTTTLYESQGHFADYFNKYAESLKPDGGNPATIPGMGIAKEFNKTDFDFPVSEACLTYVPSRFMNLQLGYGRNFIGDGYRSLIQGDGASPYPYFKINTTFWRLKYTNTYMWLKDTRTEVTIDKTYATKYTANHFLSYNISNKLNLGFFESVIWTNDNKRGFDMNFVNPIIFYRTVEFGSSPKSGNALLGLTAKYKFNNKINMYGQFLVDEFSISDVKSQNGSWKNKFGFQLGIKYYNAFQIKNLYLQFEYNAVRPYVYSHLEPITNYGHNNQNLGHQWGGNFREFVAIARYHQGRLFADAKLTLGERGLDFDTTTDSNNYGSNIYLSYNTNRPLETGVKIGQGNNTKVFIADLQSGYLVNPATNLKLYGSFIYRNFNPAADTILNFKSETSWFSLGLRCDIFNWYFDY